MTIRRVARWAAALITVLLIALAMWYKYCPPGSPEPPGKVNPAFEINPPIARDVVVELAARPTKTDSVVLVADFGRDQVRDRFHAVVVGERTFVLRDDGRGADRTADDGLFSVFIPDAPAELEREFGAWNRLLEAGQRKPVPTFVGRTLRPTLVPDSVLFDIERFRAGRRLHIPIDLIIAARPVDPALQDHSLVITAPKVVEDTTRTFNPCTGAGTPNGAWSFGHLVREMANTPATGISPEDFLMSWLDKWMHDTTCNGDLVQARAGMQSLIQHWKALCAGGALTVDKAPFKLLAIVNRLDLRGNSGYGFSNAGEGRFVFCAIDDKCQVFGQPAPFLVIFEYGIPLKSCPAVRNYAKQWFDLRALTPGTPPYNHDLEIITRVFTERNAAPSKPNGSALNQLRTNEFAFTFAASPWELREFVLDAASHRLMLTTVKKEPQTIFNAVAFQANTTEAGIFADFVNTNQAAVENNTYDIPLQHQSRNFLAGKAHTLDAVTHHWDADSVGPGMRRIASDEARFQLSLNTCSGCHGGEAMTGNFMHIGPSGPKGVPATLSGFLTGITVADRANRPGPAANRTFNDLQRRAQDLTDLVSRPCLSRLVAPELASVLRFKPLRMTH